MKTRILSIALLSVSTLYAAESSEMNRALRAASGMEANFVQRFTAKGHRRDQVERGSVLFGAAPMMRWSYRSPEEKLFVFDGKTSWFYAPSERQVTVTSLDEQQRRELPFLFLADSAMTKRHYNVSERTSRGAITTRLEARDRAAMIRSVVVTTGANDHLIRRLEYSDRQGNRTVFEFSVYRKGSATADAFRFTPPAGVEVIRN